MRRLETFDWWEELVALKDELSLRELAERFHVTPGAISAALKREGVMRQPAPPGPRVHRRRKGEEDLPPEAGEEEVVDARPGSKDALLLEHRDLLGQVPDKEVATKAGVSVRTVASFRARNGIPSYAPRRASAPEPTNGTHADPVDGKQAWKVVIRLHGRDLSRVVLADSLVDAATEAARTQSDGQVLSVAWVGELL